MYKVTDKDNQEYAFKKLIEVSCQDFSKLFKELAFNFMFDSDYQPRIAYELIMDGIEEGTGTSKSQSSLNNRSTEYSFRRMYSDLPLLNLEEIFLDYNEAKEEYICYVKMQKCEIDLQNLLDEKGSLGFEEFFPMFKDTIFGITFLHGHYMAHRDIKPSNLM